MFKWWRTRRSRIVSDAFNLPLLGHVTPPARNPPPPEVMAHFSAADLMGGAVSLDEVERAMHALHGVRLERRKRQRARAHLTYADRDGLADLIYRLYWAGNKS